MSGLQQMENQLHPAFETLQSCLRLLGDNYPPPSTGEGYRSLAIIYYEWNNLDAAEHYGQRASNCCGSMTALLTNSLSLRCFLPA